MNDLVVPERHLAAHVGGALSAIELKAQMELIQEVMRDVMKPGIDYGYVPGTEPKNEEEKKFKKPALFKSGAEKLNVLFRLGPDYEIVDKERDGDHLSLMSKCILTHIPTGQRFGSALGSCSSRESKYAYRHGAKKCPECGADAIIKGKVEYGGGWLCFGRKGGCGAKFQDGDSVIEDQQVGKVANEDKADQYNTVLKMSNKRAMIAATLNATAASAIFSQDIVDDDDLPEGGAAEQRAQRKVDQPRSKRPATPPATDASSPPPGASEPAGGAGQDDGKPLTAGARSTLTAAMARAGRTEADLTAAGFPLLADMTFAGHFQKAMDWLKKSPAVAG